VAVGPAQLLQLLLECREACPVILIVRGRGRKYADAPDVFALLSTRQERPSACRASNNFDEVSPAHGLPRGKTKNSIMVVG
jgi:hypothetical protein